MFQHGFARDSKAPVRVTYYRSIVDAKLRTCQQHLGLSPFIWKLLITRRKDGIEGFRGLPYVLCFHHTLCKSLKNAGML